MAKEFNVLNIKRFYRTVFLVSALAFVGQFSLAARAADANVHYMSDDEKTQLFTAIKKRESEKIDARVHFMSDDERRAITGVIPYTIPDAVDPIYSADRLIPSIYSVPDGVTPQYELAESNSVYKVPTGVDPIYPGAGGRPVYTIPDAADPIEVEAQVAEEITAPDVSTVEGCQIAIKEKLSSEPIVFKAGSFTVSKESIETVKEIVALLDVCTDASVVVEGHTDSSGSAAQNQRLSGKRASSVAELLENEGIEKSRLRAVGYGSSKPVAENDTDENKALNRRIELTLY